MSWTCEYEDRLYIKDDEQIIDCLARRTTFVEEVRDEFVKWVNESYTPWEALCENFDEAVMTWARDMVLHRQDIVERLLPWAHCEEVRE